jgi:PIN like domain
VDIHDDHFPNQRTPDETWLRFVGERGWIAITPDARIRYRENEKAAVKSANVRQFVLTARGRTGGEIGESLAAAVPKIRRLVEEFEPPFIGKIARGSSVSLYETFGKPKRRK